VPNVKIVAPCDGWCTALGEVPDPVFARCMLGDGLAIDPTQGIICAPCAGEIVTLPASAHAVSIRSAEGLDVLIHIGIDTVDLKGRGFVPSVKPGSVVGTGDVLIRFDLDLVARSAKSLITPILITNLDGLELIKRHTAGRICSGDVLFEIESTARNESAQHAPKAAASGAPARRVLTIALRQGLHARPAAILSQRTKSFAAAVTLQARGRVANARSIVSIMALGVRQGDELIVEAAGIDAPQAIASLVAGIEEALRMETAAHHSAQTAAAVQPRILVEPGEGALSGVIAVPGYQSGRATRIERRKIDVLEHADNAAHESEELGRALAQVRLRLQRLAATGSATRREIIEAHLEFLSDPSLTETARDLMDAGKSAGFAWRGAIRASIAALETSGEARLRERADDLLDIEAHVLLALAGEARPMTIPLPENAVLIADDLLPSELAALDKPQLAAICLAAGGATSHVAILAAALEIPMLVGLGAGLREIPDGAAVIVDAELGRLQTKPTFLEIEQARATVQHRLLKKAALRSAAHADCRALDGTRIEVFANLGNTGDALAAVANGAEGCGLLRTEFLFIDRDTEPSEEEQLGAYQAIASALGGLPLILRLMDVGGDKQLRYLPLPAEENPALGLRGVRTGLRRPDLMRTQLRAALRVEPLGQVRLLVPMVTDEFEILAVRRLVDDLRDELGISGAITLGVMIETPAAALTAAALARHADFFSIGSNDLTQYTLAMDRGHAELARRTDALHPAVLKLIAAATAAGVAAGKLVAVCGGVAADSLAVPILLGLGVREISVVPAAIPAIKRQIGGLQMSECRALALRCLELGSAGEVRSLIEEWMGMAGELR
jgi:multiphosphoryl transfer protein